MKPAPPVTRTVFMRVLFWRSWSCAFWRLSWLRSQRRRHIGAERRLRATQRETDALVEIRRRDVGRLRADGHHAAALAEPGKRPLDDAGRHAPPAELGQRANQFDLALARVVVQHARDVPGRAIRQDANEERSCPAGITVGDPLTPQPADACGVL